MTLIDKLLALPASKNLMDYRAAVNDCIAIIREHTAAPDVVEHLQQAERLLQAAKITPEVNIYSYITSAILEINAAIAAMGDASTRKDEGIQGSIASEGVSSHANPRNCAECGKPTNREPDYSQCLVCVNAAADRLAALNPREISVVEDAFHYAWGAWLYATDTMKIDRDAALKKGIEAYLYHIDRKEPTTEVSHAD